MTEQSVHLQDNGASGRRLPFQPSTIRSAVTSIMRRFRGKQELPARKQLHLGADDELPSGEGWMEWTGGSCPVEPSLVVEVVRWSSAGFVHQFGEAGTIGWRWANGNRLSMRAGNVLAFRVADALNNQVYAEAIRLAIKEIDHQNAADQDLDMAKLKTAVLGYLS